MLGERDSVELEASHARRFAIGLGSYAVALFRGFSVTREAQQVLFLETRRLRILGQTRTPFGCWLATVPQERSPRDVIRRAPSGQVVFPSRGGQGFQAHPPRLAGDGASAAVGAA